jgi:hypothetical protein
MIAVQNNATFRASMFPHAQRLRHSRAAMGTFDGCSSWIDADELPSIALAFPR